MSTPIITVQNLGKRYRVRRPGNREGSGLRHALEEGAKNLWKGLGRLVRGQVPFEAIPPEEEFWALKDVSFEVMPGECVGIIGRNGAGKSTLLKILSRITEPSAGRAIMRGRVGSLLEVGTGFHPELTGRENIFLNGAILGMRRHEILRHMDEIVAFAEVDAFLDTPVKHYSSGMYMRLAFAVAAHLDPEILIVDEVLAVGDAQFQKKCLGKMSEVARQGRTVLFVSHNMPMMAAICGRGVVLRSGNLAFDGTARDAAFFYQNNGGASYKYDPESTGKVIGNHHARLHRAWLSKSDNQPTDTFDLAEPIVVNMEYSVFKPANVFSFPNFHFHDELGNYLFVTGGPDWASPGRFNRTGRWVVSCTIPGNWLNTGSFSVGVAMTAVEPSIEVAFYEMGALAFQVTENLTQTLETSRMLYAGTVPGTLRPTLPWTIEPAAQAKGVVA